MPASVSHGISQILPKLRQRGRIKQRPAGQGGGAVLSAQAFIFNSWLLFDGISRRGGAGSLASPSRPVCGRTQRPVCGWTQRPVCGRTQCPVCGRTQRLVCGRIQRPVCGRTHSPPGETLPTGQGDLLGAQPLPRPIFTSLPAGGPTSGGSPWALPHQEVLIPGPLLPPHTFFETLPQLLQDPDPNLSVLGL